MNEEMFVSEDCAMMDAGESSDIAAEAGKKKGKSKFALAILVPAVVVGGVYAVRKLKSKCGKKLEERQIEKLRKKGYQIFDMREEGAEENSKKED